MFYPINTFHVTRDWYWKKGFLQTLETYSAKHTNKSLWVPNKCLVLSQYPKPDKKNGLKGTLRKQPINDISAVSPISPIMYLGFLWYYIYTKRRKRTSIILLKDSSDKMLVCLFVWINLHSSNGHKVLTSISLELRLGSTQKIEGRSNRNSWHVQQNYQVYNDTNVNLGTIEPVDRSIIKYTTMILVEENKRI